MHNSVADNYVEITFKNNPINKLSEHFSLAKKLAFLLWNSKRFVNHIHFYSLRKSSKEENKQ